MKLLLGNCIDKMKELPENSVDTIITDPPYGLSFMGKKWDYDVPSAELWQEALRVLKPGGTALIFAGSRTQHRMACNVEDSGFILKDCMLWIYGSGFPKATDISKQLDKGHERKVVRTIKKLHYSGSNLDTNEGWARPSHRNPDGTAKTTMDITEPSTPEAKLWNGWKSHGLKPAYEPVLTCFKPLTIEQYFGMIIEDITEEVLCQSSNVKDVEKIFSDTQAKLKKVLGHIVAGGVRTNLWENLKYVRFVDESSMSKSAEKNKKHIKDDSAQCGVKENGKVDITKKMESHQHQRADTGEKTTLAGEAENIFARILVISTSVITKSISENTALLWKNISEDLLKNARLFTIEMATKLTIGLRTLKSSLIQTTSKNIGNLSPNYEPILVAMKPNEGSYSQNALKHGVSGLNIDGGRIEGNWKTVPPNKGGRKSGIMGEKVGHPGGECHSQGRFPANLILDEEAGKMLDEQSGEIKSGAINGMYGHKEGFVSGAIQQNVKANKGGASRFFYVAKASKNERNMGCEDREPVKVSDGRQKEADNAYQRGKTLRLNSHPTVKPIKLMEYLCTLTKTPTGGVVLDPFMGSGTTGVACVNTDRKFIGIEKEPEYMEIAKKRLEYAVQKRKERLF